jgi:c(7)-type cytochrome triheme protein
MTSGRRARIGLSAVVAVAIAITACSSSAGRRVINAVFDGVPPPGARATAAPPAPADRPPSGSTAASGAAPAGLVANTAAPVLPPAPFEAHKTWEHVLKELPIDAGGGVDWVQAFNTRLVVPRLLHSTDTVVERPLTLDTLMDATVDDPRLPALDLDITIVPSHNRSFEGGEFYAVKFPHTSHTSWLGCSSCHPGVGSAKAGMLGILQGQSCGRCHGRVSFAVDMNCSRCHVNLAPPTADALRTELAAAVEAPAAASAEVVTRGEAVYKRLCAVCHGETGNGAGSLAEPLDPKPRDFTAGKYKFRSTLPASIPTDLDILTTITQGVPGTSMPAFANLSREDRWALVHYVKTFSEKFAKEQPTPIPTAPPPPASAELLATGVGLYKEAGCDTCHGEKGLGDGPSAPTLKDDWGNPLKPFSFASGRPMKGGQGADAIYKTVMTGLQGTPMPGFGDALEPAQGWAIVAFVQQFLDKDRQPFAVKGDVRFLRDEKVADTPDAKSYAPAVFPHWFHRIRVKCASCHPRVFEMKAGANAVTMDALRSGKFCATCHNGKVAWEVGFTTCTKCHATPEA